MSFPFPAFRYYDPQGQAGDVEYRIEDIDKRRIALTNGLTLDGRPVCVSTILIANAVVFSGAQEDRPFELQVRTEDTGEPVMTLRFATRQEAEQSHEAMVGLLGNEEGRAVLAELARVGKDDE